ncbi:unnamed protein product [Rotaria sordida]|uniref:Pheromone-processing carboxypeptidase KEX1 n=1 Tax=Rotaria sordida TaxID=392033 RepID=A0A813VK40_9BILA|nr:unnamed protein product [Rotaria sordida]CAF3766207.1 unnamed protein product [Rotaria sordida]
MHAGHLPVNPQHHGALFFWHFASKHIGDKSRTVIWLNGGPGCSSLIGAWAEIGPFRFQDENTIVENNGSWHMFANLLFIDQPVGTGFSYIDTDSFIHELNQMSNQFLSFLDRYIEIFPELLQDDIYLAGESFAGQHIPYIAQEILTKRSVLKLRGLLIGNGWIDPVTTYESYLPFAVANNLVENNSVLYSNIANQVKVCQQALSNEVHVIDEACELILNQIKVYGAMNNHYTTKEKDRCVNVYDVRLDDTWPDCGMNWPSDIKYVTLYLHRQDVKSRIHVSSKKSGWTECADSVFQTFRAYHSIPSIKLLPDLLRQIPIVLYSGEYDLICNHWGTEKMMDTMTWNNGTGFDLGNGTLAPLEPWIVDDEPVGLIRTARNLTYVLFYNASHMVPYNYARRSRTMLHQFIQLNLSSNADQTTKNNTVKKMNQTTHRAGFIAVTSIIVIIALAGLTWFVICKQQQIGIPTSFSRTRVLWSHNRDFELQQLVMHSLVDDANENFYASGDETFV